MHDLMTRVLSAIPAGAYEMNARSKLLRIEETRATFRSLGLGFWRMTHTSPADVHFQA
jgi:hypothetical protein